MGSGTTAIACMNTNRNYIGFELDEEYYNLANERVEKHKEILNNENDNTGTTR
ncbi:putative cytosine specific DNA methyltransferase [Staphylococcus phage KSAP7]|nr:putative cytosine specific DNA methyltransferase [Staphylococcus phage KSAP7]BBM81492.1 putative cytosine specific DNA methyltransferase [Staphylococcus phage KSAP11]